MGTSALQSRVRTRTMTVAALCAALLAASAWIIVPIGTVPVTFQVFIVLLAGLLLSSAEAALTVGVYLLLGAVGVPVFAGGLGGLGVLFGPTGGFLVGFLLAAPLISGIRTRLASRAGASGADAIASLIGVAVIYCAGWLQLMLVTGMGPWAAAFAGVAPFVAIDIAKAVVALGVAAAVRRSGVLALSAA